MRKTAILFLTFFVITRVAHAITAEIRRISDDAVVATGVNFQTVSNTSGFSQAEHYLRLSYQTSETDLDSIYIFSNNSQASSPRDGLRHLPSLNSRAPVYYRVYDQRQQGVTMTPANRAAWGNLSDVNDAGFPHVRVPTYPTGTTYVYFASEVNSSNPVGSYEVQIQVKNFPLQILTHPNSQIIFHGRPVTFAVAAQGVPSLTFEWLKNGSRIAGANSSTLVVPQVTLLDNDARFRCIVRDGLGRQIQSNEAVLVVVSAPIIVTQPQSQTVLEGQPATFSILAVGFPNPQYQWFRNRAAIPGATAASFTIPATSLSETGHRFSCVVLNDLGYVESELATLTVRQIASPPVITVHPQSQSVPEGRPVTFGVVAVGQNLRYTWYRNGAPISNTNNQNYSITSVGTADNGAQFFCRVANDAGSVDSDAATLTVSRPNIPPIIQSHPVSQYVNQGQSATFSVEALSSLPMTYQWQKNQIDIEGATSRSYTTPPTSMADNGSRFRCLVSNSQGSTVSNEAVLTVIPQVNFYSLSVVNGSGSGSYIEGSLVTIVANPPASGTVFERWVGAAVANPELPTTTIMMPAAATVVTATYRNIAGGDPLNLKDGFGSFSKIIKLGEGQTCQARYHLSKNGPVELTVYDRKGTKLKELVKAEHIAGDYEVSWDGRTDDEKEVASGPYVLVLKILNTLFKTRVVLIR